MAVSFKDYIKGRRRTDTPQGDFVDDARDDRNLPDAKSWSELENYLLNRRAIPDAIAAARLVWRQYRTMHPS